MVSIEDAKNMRSGIDVEGYITKKGEVRNVNTKSGGTIDVCDAYLKDDSGEVKLTLWAEDAKNYAENDKVKITNGYTSTFKGEVQLSKGKYGKMENLTQGS